jgi:hypothetical protein
MSFVFWQEFQRDEAAKLLILCLLLWPFVARDFERQALQTSPVAAC